MEETQIPNEIKVAILDDEIARCDRTVYLLSTRAKVYSTVFSKDDSRVTDTLKELEEVVRVRDAFSKERQTIQ